MRYRSGHRGTAAAEGRQPRTRPRRRAHPRICLAAGPGRPPANAISVRRGISRRWRNSHLRKRQHKSNSCIALPTPEAGPSATRAGGPGCLRARDRSGGRDGRTDRRAPGAPLVTAPSGWARCPAAAFHPLQPVCPGKRGVPCRARAARRDRPRIPAPAPPPPPRARPAAPCIRRAVDPVISLAAQRRGALPGMAAMGVVGHPASGQPRHRPAGRPARRRAFTMAGLRSAVTRGEDMRLPRRRPPRSHRQVMKLLP